MCPDLLLLLLEEQPLLVCDQSLDRFDPTTIDALMKRIVSLTRFFKKKNTPAQSDLATCLTCPPIWMSAHSMRLDPNATMEYEKPTKDTSDPNSLTSSFFEANTCILYVPTSSIN